MRRNLNSSRGSRVGRVSGLSTPRMTIVNFDSDTSINYFDSVPQSLSLRLNHSTISLSPNTIGKSRLVVRTESKERFQRGREEV
jgi:Golgi apyrase